ncbi:hypothetical protein V1477_000861, partial [Vespula maculifrons]
MKLFLPPRSMIDVINLNYGMILTTTRSLLRLKYNSIKLHFTVIDWVAEMEIILRQQPKKNADYAFTRRDSVMRFWLRYLSTLKVITRGFGLLGKINLSLLRWYSSELVHVSVLLKIETLWKPCGEGGCGDGGRKTAAAVGALLKQFAGSMREILPVLFLFHVKHRISLYPRDIQYVISPKIRNIEFDIEIGNTFSLSELKCIEAIHARRCQYLMDTDHDKQYWKDVKKSVERSQVIKYSKTGSIIVSSISSIIEN